tara:strand:+ start:1028 stop:1732 length:705 start_codon:yes stop_codon:yes gene_type:complete
MSLLTIAQAIADELGVFQPSSIIGNEEATAVRLRSVTSAAGLYLRDDYDWAVLTKEHTFTSAADTAAYSFPSDFLRMVPDTAWDRTNDLQMIGPITPAQWQYYKGAITTDVGLAVRWRLRPTSGTLKFELENPDAASLAYEYISEQWCASSSGTGQTDWAADTDVPIFSEDLVFREGWWRALRAFGFPYEDQKNDSRQWLKSIFERERGGGRNINMAPATAVFTTNLPDTGYGS